MPLWGRFLVGGRSKAYSEGMALLEAERFAEAVDRLRTAALGRSDSPSHSLASFHFRQALVAEARRLLRAGQPRAAVPFLAEAVGHWDLYPDLHCLHGAACGLGGDWERALAESRAALRLNADYAEARLLEAVALERLARPQEAVRSLEALVESGRRIEHWVVAAVERAGPLAPGSLPAELLPWLQQAVSGRSEREEVAAAVARCRGGDWEAGVRCFADLVAKRPRYPDYRTRHAAALFQLGRNPEALAEVEAALALNEQYRTAIDLKGLILADTGRIPEARGVLEEADARLGRERAGSAHEELFGAYLRGVLDLLTGRPERVGPRLADWSDLSRHFARAELLLAAADHQLGHATTCARRLAQLAQEWSAEPDYALLLACHHLEGRRYQEAAGVLGRWPAGERNDQRPRFLEGSLAVCQGRAPAAAAPVPAEGALDVSAAAWAFLAARAHFLQGRDAACWRACRELVAAGHASERILRLQLLAAAGAVAEVPADWEPATVLPERCLGAALNWCLLRGDAAAARALLHAHVAAHPENLDGYWLDPDFWFAPVRNWIA